MSTPRRARPRADHQAAQARQRHRCPEPDPDRPTVTVSEWRYAGSGLLHGEQFWAEQTRNRIQSARRLRRQARTEATQRDHDREAS